MLGHEETGRCGFLDRRRPARRCAEISGRYGFDVDPDALVEDLPVGVQQRVEIVKALTRDAKVLILDEPTAVLTPQEIDELIDIMRRLRDAGTSIVFITHKLRRSARSPTGSPSSAAARWSAAPPPANHRAGAGRADGRAARSRSPWTRRPPRPEDAGAGVCEALGCSTPPARCMVDDVTLHRARRGDLRHRRGAGQRPDRADRGAARAVSPRQRPVTAAGRGHHLRPPSTRCSAPASDTCPRTGCTTAWSAPSRSRRTSCSTATTGRRSPAASRWTSTPIAQNADSRVAEFDVRTASVQARASTPVRRQPAEGGAGPGTVPAAGAAGRLPADPRAGRRLDGVRAPADRRRSATAAPPVVLVSTELDEVARAGRPDRGDVPRPDHRRSARGHLRASSAGPADGRARSSNPTGAAATADGTDDGAEDTGMSEVPGQPAAEVSATWRSTPARPAPEPAAGPRWLRTLEVGQRRGGDAAVPACWP